MAKASLEKNKFTISLSEKEMADLELPPDAPVEIVKAKKGVWVLLESEETEKKAVDLAGQAQQKIMGLLAIRSLQERVEGKFERLLSPSEQIIFEKMLSQGIAERYKSKPEYNKSVYRIKPADTKKTFESTEKNPDEYSLEKDGFVVAKTEFAAQKLSEKLGEKIKSGQVKGTRVFSGEFFIIDSWLHEQKSKAVLEFLKAKKNASLAELKSALQMPPTLIRIICAFLSEDGAILERRKEQYQFIE